MILKIEALNFAYNKERVLKNINLEAEKGKLITLIGPNGSGKSTLLKCINNYLVPNQGIIKIKNKNIKDFTKKELAKIIAYVPQASETKFNLNVFETILMGRKAHSGWKATQKDKDITAKVICEMKLDKIAFKDINNLSGGQQQKVFIARAVAQAAEIILLDEPTNNLDLKHQLEIFEMIENEVSTGKTVIVTMHDLSLVSRFSDRIIMLKDGCIYSDGTGHTLSASNINSVYGVEVSLKEHNGKKIIIPEKIYV
ncbi:ABC transporter ATP-binding protein [Halanaerobium sp.]|uniref:ABC transporter ATP-binding protein n=1 Tax=Halanaerobium sp. TaxID=1895664 RepID=UPI000DE69F02|nr:ABC transporter ATP-binding protein [Halanaerobium sp.]PUU86424.1 MAG: iron complex transport system ATP-binding protein [Halanaerobium sp.]